MYATKSASFKAATTRPVAAAAPRPVTRRLVTVVRASDADRVGDKASEAARDAQKSVSAAAVPQPSAAAAAAHWAGLFGGALWPLLTFLDTPSSVHCVPSNPKLYVLKPEGIGTCLSRMVDSGGPLRCCCLSALHASTPAQALQSSSPVQAVKCNAC